jgi:hypothetical protein
VGWAAHRAEGLSAVVVRVFQVKQENYSERGDPGEKHRRMATSRGLSLCQSLEPVSPRTRRSHIGLATRTPFSVGCGETAPH